VRGLGATACGGAVRLGYGLVRAQVQNPITLSATAKVTVGFSDVGLSRQKGIPSHQVCVHVARTRGGVPIPAKDHAATVQQMRPAGVSLGLPPTPLSPLHRVRVRGDRLQMFGPDPAQDRATLVRTLVIEVDHERGPGSAHLTPLQDKSLVWHPRGVAGVDPYVPDAPGGRQASRFDGFAPIPRLEHVIE